MTNQLPSRQLCLAKLRTISLAKLPECCNDITTCSICFGDLADKAKKGTSERAVRLHGTHIFGALCIRKWLEEHDSCPICRTKVHTGADNDDGRIVSDLHEQVRLLTCRRPTIDRPINDLEVFKLSERLWKGSMIVTSARIAAQLESSMCNLMMWRVSWWERNPLCLSLPDFAPYTRTQALRLEDLNVPIVLHEERDLRLLTRMVDSGLRHGVIAAVHDLSFHVGAHPVFRSMEDAMRRLLLKARGKRMLVSTLAISLREAIESDPRTRGVLTGEREDLPRGLQFYWEDFIVVFLRRLIETRDGQ